MRLVVNHVLSRLPIGKKNGTRSEPTTGGGKNTVNNRAGNSRVRVVGSLAAVIATALLALIPDYHRDMKFLRFSDDLREIDPDDEPGIRAGKKKIVEVPLLDLYNPLTSGVVEDYAIYLNLSQRIIQVGRGEVEPGLEEQEWQWLENNYGRLANSNISVERNLVPRNMRVGPLTTEDLLSKDFQGSTLREMVMLQRAMTIDRARRMPKQQLIQQLTESEDDFKILAHYLRGTYEGELTPGRACDILHGITG